jgi:hypothetical protein
MKWFVSYSYTKTGIRTMFESTILHDFDLNTEEGIKKAKAKIQKLKGYPVWISFFHKLES